MKKNIRLLICIMMILAVVLCVLTACNTAIQSVDFEVTFTVDGESYYVIVTQGAEVLKMPNDPTKEGFVFDGWFWDKDTWQRPFTRNSFLNQRPTSNIKVYAKFSCKHNIVDDYGYAATCTENGLTDGSHCDKCNEVIQTQTVIPALGHSMVYGFGQPPTCTEVGWCDYECCIHCSYDTKVEIESTGHSASDWIVETEGDCLSDGYRFKECTVCHTTLEEEYKYAQGHYIEYVGDRGPTCTENGWYSYEYCTNCDYSTKVEIEAKGHHFKSDWKTDEKYHWHEADCGCDEISESDKSITCEGSAM